MGVTFSSLFTSITSLVTWSKNRDLRILILGLDSAGKTTILYRLQLGEVIQSAPTVGFNVETIKYKNLTFQVWDLGGQTSVRPYWRCYYADTTAVIFVVDSTDVQRMPTCRSELQSLLAEDELKTAKLLVFANKQDLSGALDAAAVAEHLGLQSLKDRTWTIVKCSAKEGTGLEEGLDWLVNAIQQ